MIAPTRPAVSKPMMRPHLRRLLTALVLLHCSTFTVVALAADSLPAETGTTLQTLLQEAADKNQELLVATSQAQRYQARIELVEYLDDPLLAFYYINFPVLNPFGEKTQKSSPAAEAAKPGETGQSFRQQARVDRSKFMAKLMAENQAVWYQSVREDVLLQLARRIKENFFRIYFLDRTIAETESNLAALTQIIALSQARYAVGKVSQKELLKAQSERALLQGQLLNLRQQRLALAAETNYLAARPPGSPLVAKVDAELDHRNLPQPAATAAELTADLRRQRPLLRGYQALMDRISTMRLMAPMYFTRRVKEDARLEAESEWRAVKAKAADFSQQVAADIVTTHGNLTKNLELARLYGNVLVPQARQLFEASLAEVEVGRDDLRGALQALLDLNRYQGEYFQMLAGCQVDLARLEGLSGLELFGETP